MKSTLQRRHGGKRNIYSTICSAAMMRKQFPRHAAHSMAVKTAMADCTDGITESGNQLTAGCCTILNLAHLSLHK
jgi:hypothetical protein